MPKPYNMMKKLDLLSICIVVFLFCGCAHKTIDKDVTYADLPRWRGFNLLEKFQDKPDSLSVIAPIWSYHNEPFREEDFQMISELGFNFVRLPMSYKCWVEEDNPLAFREDILREIDQAVEWGRKYGLHVSINMHRAPGYCINAPHDKESLWDNDSVLNVCTQHWAMFAKRYKGIPSSELSFDLINEPVTTDEKYYKVVSTLCEAIRKEDPHRLIITDGNACGNAPVASFKELKVAQSGRGYAPGYLTHYLATWSSPDYAIATVPPVWPQVDEFGKKWDKETLQDFFSPWFQLHNEGIGVHIGEWGVFNKTPHDVTLAFMEDVLSLLKENNIGWALWNFRGTFGIVDSGREDVIYEDYKGHKIDREMLELLQKY